VILNAALGLLDAPVCVSQRDRDGSMVVSALYLDGGSKMKRQ